MNKVGWIIFSAIVVVVLGGLVAWGRISNPPINLTGINNNSIIVGLPQNGNIADHVTGASDAKITFIEYGDFQCPSCGGAFTGVSTLIKDYGDKVTFIFRNFPLTTIHPNARAAAGVAEAAGLQGKYWQMHDLLYTNQNDWSSLDASKRTTIFESYANSLALNMDKYHTDLKGAEVNQKISFDQALGKSVSVSATPTFFLNGEKVDDTTSSGLVQNDLTAIKAKLDALVK
jgi:protein-disulfide isomerase